MFGMFVEDIEGSVWVILFVKESLGYELCFGEGVYCYGEEGVG